MPPETTTKIEADEKPGFRQGGATPTDDQRPENDQARLNERLDDAVEETFPASDPVSVKITK
ncbi:MAG: hypothetical protein K2Y56_21700 [Methylobacterium sp.]|uniref:hypothetical protein n=1 Tax=Methylobacterium sp. TaxID=409 RepID=UPI0025EE32E5|nr:hypothetical protein [Methylobacterium sp.]MBX9934099.1 hypothetical protein [Methylobacterium sp.]